MPEKRMSYHDETSYDYSQIFMPNRLTNVINIIR